MYFFLFFFLFSLFFLGSAFLVFFYGCVVWGIYLFSLLGLDFYFSFIFDYVSLGFFFCVSFICFTVFIYSMFYMDGEVDQRRFLWLVFGFVISMMFLVFSGGFLSLMIGWDGLGLISFCLVIFYANFSSLESGLLTVFSNRVGDVFFLGCFYFFFGGGFGVSDFYCGWGLLFFCFLFFGSITKSAQAPFSAWLPAAMAAPTPVSSLVHSSTLVTAGIYVLLRFHYLFDSFGLIYLKVFFLFTMLLSGGCACLEMDFKKIVAMSTLSQLGLMMFVLSMGFWMLTFFHMVIHAFFKSMLFLNTGKLMSGFSGGQDSRFYGSDYFSGAVFSCFSVSSFCLMGFPFFIGFYSKDTILLSGSFFLGAFFFLFFLLGCLLTVFYSFRLMFLSFGGFNVGYSFIFFLENWFFFFSVGFLFFFCWFFGGLVFWSMGFGVLSLGGFDVLLGLGLISVVFFLYSSFFSLYVLSSLFFYIGYLRWFGGSSVSNLMGGLYFFRYDASWVELMGGRGVHLFLHSFVFFEFFIFLSMGVIFFGVLVFMFF